MQEAEKKNEGVLSADAAANPALLKKSGPLPTGPSAARPVQKGLFSPAAKPGLPVPPAAAKTVAPAIKRSPFRKPIGMVVEMPTTTAPKPMEEVKGRAMGPAPGPQRPHLEPKEDAPLLMKPSPLPLSALPSRHKESVRLDPKGRRLSRPDRWEDSYFEWEAPVLPSSELPRPMRAAVAQGRFTQRVLSLFEDRPEAVDRLCAAAEARAALSGEEALLRELSEELMRKRWQEKRAPKEQLARLRAIESDPAHPLPWRAVARFLIDRLVST